MLCAENRKEMEDWISSLKSVQTREPYEVAQFNVEHFSGMHNWYACSHARPTFCNVCRESLSGVTSHGLSCEGTHCLQRFIPSYMSTWPV
uniref:PH domain-containing protein n=1 Tax=Propithecus coquereli TaxID=379532 RepID=A0A2K6FHV9_PROCO